MTTERVSASSRPSSDFHHAAFIYSGEDDFLEGMVPFLRAGATNGDAMLVAVGARKIALLTDALGADAAAVRFEDMTQIGRNPAWIIPAWNDFVAANPGRSLRGIGEPIYSSRTSAELVECQRHEALLNVAFAGTPDFQLLCPYDIDTLDDDVLREALATHPVVQHGAATETSASYLGLDTIAAPFDKPLPVAPTDARQMPFTIDSLTDARTFAADAALDMGFRAERVEEVVLAVSEIATNSVRHGGGGGLLRSWSDGRTLIVEITDDGSIGDPLAGRRRPRPDQEGGYGLWLVNRLSQLVQVRTSNGGTVIRVHFAPA